MDGGSESCRVSKLKKMNVGVDVGGLIVQERQDRRARVRVHGRVLQSLSRLLALEPAGSIEREASRVEDSAVRQIVGRFSEDITNWEAVNDSDYMDTLHGG